MGIGPESEYTIGVSARRSELTPEEWKWLQQVWNSERRGGIRTVFKQCPFSELVWSQIGALSKPKAMQGYANFLAWMLMRERNPFFTQGTGWEGYAVAHTVQPAHVLEWELQLGKSMIDRMYEANPPGSVRQEYLRFMEGKLSVANLRYWNAAFGAELARQRARTLQHPLARAYRLQTYQQLPTISEVSVALEFGTSFEQYMLPQIELHQVQRIDLSREFERMTDLQQVSLRLLCLLGMLGHPAVRLAQQVLYDQQYLDRCVVAESGV